MMALKVYLYFARLKSDNSNCFFVENNYHNYFSLLGYVGSKSFLEKVADIIKDLRKSDPALTYGKFYKT